MKNILSKMHIAIYILDNGGLTHMVNNVGRTRRRHLLKSQGICYQCKKRPVGKTSGCVCDECYKGHIRWNANRNEKNRLKRLAGKKEKVYKEVPAVRNVLSAING
jgi:hypothetical protein